MGREKRRFAKKRSDAPSRSGYAPPVGIRIIGGRFRGRKLLYGGDPRVRPMKDRVREALFNVLGPAVREKHAIDLFAGTGALGLEAVSRGAARATLVEQHRPTARTLRQNVATLGLEDVCRVVTADAFAWALSGLPPGAEPWLVFSSPPYDFYVDRRQAMLDLLGGLIEQAPSESLFVVECDERFDGGLLPEAAAWSVRTYPPALLAIYRKPLSQPEAQARS